MQVTKFLSLLFFTCLLFTKGQSQETAFSANGKLTKLVLTNYQVKSPDATSLKTLSDNSKKDAVNIIKAKVDETIKNLSDNSKKLDEFYQWLWGAGQTAPVLADLQALSKTLGENKFNGRSLSLLTHLKTPLEANLLGSSPNNCYSFDAASGKLTYKNPFNSFIIQYYNAVYPGTSALVKNFNLSQWIEYSQYIPANTEEQG